MKNLILRIENNGNFTNILNISYKIKFKLGK